MNNPNLRIKSVPQVLVNPPNRASSEARFAPLCVVVTALVWLAALASATTPASASTNFGSVNVCPSGTTTPSPCSATKTITFDIQADTTISSIAIVTTGVPGLDFKAKADDTSNTLCKAQHYSAATTCTVDVTFTPLAPGARNGAVELLDGSRVLNTRYIYGAGVGPQIAFTPSVKKTIAALPFGSGGRFGYLRPLAVDAAGNVFIADPDSNALKEFVAATGAVKTLLSDFPRGYPTAVAVDGAGNVFFLPNPLSITIPTTGTVGELVAASGYTEVKTFTIDFPAYYGLAIDGSGNLFTLVQDTTGPSKQVNEILQAGGYTTTKAIGTGDLQDAEALAVDADDNLYVGGGLYTGNGGRSPGAAEKILAAGGYTTIQVLGSGIDYDTTGLAVDAAENLYVTGDADGTVNSVFELAATDGYATLTQVGTNYNSPQELAIDDRGNLYVTDRDPELHVLLRPQPHALAFDSTAVGSTSSDSPQSIVFQNIGNATLSGTGILTNTADFTIVPGSGTIPDCTSTTLSLTGGAECSISIDFTPQSTGPLTGSLDVTDNALNVAGPTQSIGLSGTGTTP